MVFPNGLFPSLTVASSFNHKFLLHIRARTVFTAEYMGIFSKNKTCVNIKEVNTICSDKYTQSNYTLNRNSFHEV